MPTIYRRLWRVSAEQWGAAVQTLLNLPQAPLLTARGGEANFAFFSDISLEVDNEMQFNMYQLAQQAVASIDSKVGTTVAPCPSGASATAQTQCAQTFIQSFAQKAYRRTLDSDEVPNLMQVYQQGAMQSYKAGIELMIEAALIAPSFVYRTELGPPSTPDAKGNYPDTTLTPYEVASQLGFTLLNTVPDDELLAAAANGSLGTKAGIQQQVQRLLGLPAVQSNLTNVIMGWFNVNQMFAKIHDTALLSALSPADQDQTVLENDLETSTQDWVSSILWKGSNKVDDLLTSQTVYVNQRLATLYPGLSYSGGRAPTDNTTFVAATWPESQGRSGILTQPSWLWAQSDPSVMSIVKRGKAIHDNVVCADPLGSPVDLTTPQAKNVIACKSPDGTMTLSACNTEVDNSNARMTFAPCNGCHTQMDPYSRVLNDFGPIGNYQPLTEVELGAGTSPTGGPADTTVTFSRPPGTPASASPLAPQTITGAQAMAKALIATGQFDGCAVEQIASYVIGSQITAYNTCEFQPVRAAIDGTVQSLFTEVLTASFMRARAGGTQ